MIKGKELKDLGQVMNTDILIICGEFEGLWAAVKARDYGAEKVTGYSMFTKEWNENVSKRV